MDMDELGIDTEAFEAMKDRDKAAKALASSPDELRAHAAEILINAKDLDDPKLIKGQVDLAQAFLRAARDVLTNEDF